MTIVLFVFGFITIVTVTEYHNSDQYIRDHYIDDVDGGFPF